MLILLSDSFAPDLPGRLKKFGEVTDDKKRLADADVVIVRSKTKATKEFIDSAPKLKYIIRGGVGLDNVDAAHAKTKGIKVDNTPEASSIAVAEMAFSLMNAVPSRIIEAHNSMKEGKWLKKELERTELYGKTLGLIGVGRIGTELAKRAAAFGMKVIAYDKFVTSNPHAQLKKTLDELLKEADYISLHTPLTDETKGMINKNTIAKMKKGVVVVNSGRGKCIVEEDVVEGLKSGHIRAYATDVYFSDPPENSPLINAPNVVLTPHLGASTEENLNRIGDEIVKKIEAFSKGNK
jgi:D-3-phosphoglycerate dehydrogenase